MELTNKKLKKLFYLSISPTESLIPYHNIVDRDALHASPKCELRRLSFRPEGGDIVVFHIKRQKAGSNSRGPKRERFSPFYINVV